MKRDVANSTHWVYIYRDRDGRALYVGCTSDWATRNSSHKSSQPWFNDALPMEILDVYPDRGSARSAETRAIKQYKPLHNVLDNMAPKPDIHDYPTRYGDHYEDRFAKQLRARLIAAGIGPRQAANATGIPPATLRRILSTGDKLSVLHIQLLASLLDLNPSDIALSVERAA